MNAPAMLSGKPPSEELVGVGFSLVRLRSFDQATTGILDEHHAAIRDLQRQFTELQDLRTALGADADTSHEECVTAAVEGRKALAAEASVAMDETSVVSDESPGDALEMLREYRGSRDKRGYTVFEELDRIIAAMEAERACADIRVENAQGALRLAQEALAAEKRAHEATLTAGKEAMQVSEERFRELQTANETLTSLRSDLAARDATIGEMAGSNDANIIAWRTETRRLSEQLEAERKSATAVRLERDDAQQESADLREKLASAELLLGQADETVDYLREKLRQAEAKASGLESALAKSGAAHLESANALDRRERDLTTARAESASLAERLADLERDRSQLSLAHHAEVTRADLAERRLRFSEEHTRELTERLAEVERERDDARAARDSEERWANHYQKQEEKLRTQLAARSSEGLREAMLSVVSGREPHEIFTVKELRDILVAHPAENPTPAAGGLLFDRGLSADASITIDGITGTAAEWAKVHRERDRLMVELAEARESRTFVRKDALDAVEQHLRIVRCDRDDLRTRVEKADGMLEELTENYSAPGSWEVAQRAHMIRVALTTPSEAPEQAEKGAAK